MGRERVVRDPILQDAAIRRLEIVGEAAGHVSKKLRDRYPDVPWSKMRRFASFAKHEYWRIDAARLWTALESMRSVRAEVSRIRVDNPPRE